MRIFSLAILCAVLVSCVTAAAVGDGGDCCTDPSKATKYETCCQGKCCPKISCCGAAGSETCCKSYQVCCAGSTCCDRQNCCGSSCCKEDEHCMMSEARGLHCCPQELVCNDECCSNCCHGRYCCNDTSQCCSESLCCPLSTHRCCGEVCCPHAKECCGADCCDPSTSQCGEIFDPDSKSTVKTCVPFGEDSKYSAFPETLATDAAHEPVVRISFLPLDEGDATVVECLSTKTLLVVDLAKDGIGATWKSTRLKAHILGPDHEKFLQVFVLSYVNDLTTYSYAPKLFTDDLSKSNLEKVVIAGHVLDHQGSVSDWLLQTITKVEELNEGRPCSTEGCRDDFLNPLFACGTKARVDVVAANIGPRKSMVLRITVGEFSAILPGGLTGESETADLLDDIGDLLTDVSLLKVSSHGAEDENTNIEDFTSVTNPEVAVISNGLDANHPSCELVQRIATRDGSRIGSRTGPVRNDTGLVPTMQCSHRFWKGKVPHYHITPFLWDVFSTGEEHGRRRIVTVDVASDGDYIVSSVAVPERSNFLSKSQQAKWNRWWQRQVTKKRKRLLEPPMPPRDEL